MKTNEKKTKTKTLWNTVRGAQVGWAFEYAHRYSTDRRIYGWPTGTALHPILLVERSCCNVKSSWKVEISCRIIWGVSSEREQIVIRGPTQYFFGEIIGVILYLVERYNKSGLSSPALGHFNSYPFDFWPPFQNRIRIATYIERLRIEVARSLRAKSRRGLRLYWGVKVSGHPSKFLFHFEISERFGG